MKEINTLYSQLRSLEAALDGKHPWGRFFQAGTEFLLQNLEVYEGLRDCKISLAAAQKIHSLLFVPEYPENYSTNLVNPDHAVEIFGEKAGLLFASVLAQAREITADLFRGRLEKVREFAGLLEDGWNLVQNNGVALEELQELLLRHRKQPSAEENRRKLRDAYDPDTDFVTRLVLEADLSNPVYLYRYGIHISDNELRLARFFNDYEPEKLEKLAAHMTRAFLLGFQRDNKDRGARDVVAVMFHAGQELLVRPLLRHLQQAGLRPHLRLPATTPANRQVDYDHRFDAALYFDSDYTKATEELYRKVMEEEKALGDAYAGIILVDSFGEPPFAPANSKLRLLFYPAQQQLNQNQQAKMGQIQNHYFPRGHTSFSIIPFPDPAVGDHFEEIFRDILEVNMLDSETWEGIQKHLIDILDQAQQVEVRGRGNNRTRITVQLPPLRDPARHSNFLNTGATVNIPVGEVFTSPQLEGTNGVLHVEETFLGGLKYLDLELTFQDGYITGYRCGNHPTEEENRRYIEENLLFPHTTLPLGEFAIGTNTLAYVTAQRWGIQHLLPILITEKMGPHFAIGDTCFTHEEDHPVYNPVDGKEMTARENSKTALRRENPENAYTFKHIDITLPYDGLAEITAVLPDGTRRPIIHNGRFVVPGTEILNEPLHTERKPPLEMKEPS